MVFPCLLTWEKDLVCNKPLIDSMSFTMWPKLGTEQFPSVSALITVAASPSNMECAKPSSSTNWTALRAARTSRTFADSGLAIFSAIAATTCPLLFLTTTPILAWSDSANIAPSKLAFTTAPSGGFHLKFRCVDLFTPARNWIWKSLRRVAAFSKIFSSEWVLNIILY